jgi:nicotinamide riboside kinase
MVKRVALVGASSTGKTTVYELLKSKLEDYKFINESTRTVKRYGFPINEAGTNETQLAISNFHLEALLKPSNLLLDRGYIDLVAYSRHMSISEPTLNYIEETFERVCNEYTHYVYFPIEFEAVDDGERSVNEDWRRTIDMEFCSILGDLDQPYLTVTGSPLQRVEQILNFIK